MISSHLLSLVEDMCDYVVMMKNGSVLFSGSLDQARQLGSPCQTLEQMLFTILLILSVVPAIVVSVFGGALGFFIFGNPIAICLMAAAWAFGLLVPILWITGRQFEQRESTS